MSQVVQALVGPKPWGCKTLLVVCTCVYIRAVHRHRNCSEARGVSCVAWNPKVASIRQHAFVPSCARALVAVASTHLGEWHIIHYCEWHLVFHFCRALITCVPGAWSSGERRPLTCHADCMHMQGHPRHKQGMILFKHVQVRAWGFQDERRIGYLPN